MLPVTSMQKTMSTAYVSPRTGAAGGARLVCEWPSSAPVASAGVAGTSASGRSVAGGVSSPVPSASTPPRSVAGASTADAESPSVATGAGAAPSSVSTPLPPLQRQSHRRVEESLGSRTCVGSKRFGGLRRKAVLSPPYPVPLCGNRSEGCPAAHHLRSPPSDEREHCVVFVRREAIRGCGGPVASTTARSAASHGRRPASHGRGPIRPPVAPTRPGCDAEHQPPTGRVDAASGRTWRIRRPPDGRRGGSAPTPRRTSSHSTSTWDASPAPAPLLESP